ncbi:hypothetical protein BH10PAT1_BH10PAT1_5140 [soil metagenome]
MKIIPVMTEQTMKVTKNNGFTFIVPKNLDKDQIKKLIEKVYNVTVIDIKTITSKSRTKKTARGQTQKVKSVKKTVVFLKAGDKIDLFEEEKKVKKTKNKAKKEVKDK